MARRKVNPNETAEDRKQRIEMEAISNLASKTEKLSWKRSYSKIETFVQRLKPIEEKILALESKKMPILNDIHELRQEMVQNCIHPIDLLVYHNNHVKCKFCEKNISLMRKSDKDKNL